MLLPKPDFNLRQIIRAGGAIAFFVRVIVIANRTES